MGRATQPVSINGLEFDALISESRGFEASVPEYAVEKGFSVSDAIIIGAEKLNMTLFVTNTPVTWHERHGTSLSRVDDVINKLEEMYFSADVVTIITSDATYTDMAIESMTISKSLEQGYSREVPISFKKIRVTEARTTTIPNSYGKSGVTAAPAGTANTTTKSASSKSAGSSSSSSSKKSSSGSGGSSSTGSASSSSNGKSEKSSILYGAAKSIGLI